ncbi:uncharacterized protein EI97DRAFT_468260 [Westerdykella ornata]|uniref:PHD finger domain-containing protein n=1 Tax=Westerdykella ornata TaxID=318751 RepID=A0A6A6JEJ0_WESOR|nr:uncharacterized protein EI97DRAFT_468260 [Westerdykella ornata]KAF2274981.1 hypothetical protein EI97DRAFT_468260 [Westerdykella ornata]
MAATPGTPRQRVRSAGRPPRRTVSDSAPPLKKRRYIPGGPGGGGRYVDEDGQETPVGGTGPGGYAYTGPRGRIGRLNAERQGIPVPEPSPSATHTRPRRQRPPAGPRSSSAAAAAAIVAQTDGYKPREERGWEEFHQDLDIEAAFPVFSADQVDGISPAQSTPGTPVNGGTNHFAVDSKSSAILDEALRAQAAQDANNIPRPGAVNGNFVTPARRRVGRPPRKLDSMLNGLGSPPAPRVTPLPTMNPKEKLNLPKPSCRQVDPFKVFEESEGVKVNYVDKSMANLGYQESEIFVKPEKSLIRLPEGSIEEDLDLTLKSDLDTSIHAVPIGRVEYDMDEQDDRWLEQVNAQRREENAEPIKPAIFEITITQIEKEWHALEKRIPKPNPKPPQTHRPRSSSAAAVNGEPAGQGEEQDTKCAICDDGDCENTNAIVFCDGCDLAVHQECYGVPFIPEGQWLCRRCQLVGRIDHPGCIFCPNLDGAFKQTTNMKWSHLLCALFIPEVSIANTTFMEPVQDVEKVPRTRWKLTCMICKQKMGACIQCAHKSCFEAFHVTCARKARLCLRTNIFSRLEEERERPPEFRGYCDRHTPLEWRKENDVERAVAEAKAFYRHTMRHVHWGDSQAYALSLGSALPQPSIEGPEEVAEETPGNKRKREQPTKSWRLPSGAPVIPQAIYQNVEHTLSRFSIRKRKEFVQEACKYWTLKREARRGAPLLKRLQLQMEAFTSMEITRRDFAGMGAAGRPRLQRRIEFAKMLEKDMEQIQFLCEKVKEREATKLEDILLLRNIIDTVYFPIPPLLQPILDKAQSLDNRGLFSEGFNAIQAKLNEKFYTSVQAFSNDISGVFSSVIDFATVTDMGEAENQLSGVEHSSLTSEQKQIKALAKRIIKAIHPLYKEALRKESDLAGRPYAQDIPDLEALLDQKLGHQTNAPVLNQEQHVRPSTETDLGESAHVAPDQMDRSNSDVTAKESHGPNQAPTPEENSADPHLAARDEDADEAAIAAQFNRDALRSAEPDAMEIDLPEASDHGTGAGEAPITPPRSEKDLLAPLANGGIPWYMEAFDPVGTTIHDEKWTGRDVLREMSECLTEMDDDELDGLVGSDDIQPGDGTAPVPEATPAQKVVRKAKKRRLYR